MRDNRQTKVLSCWSKNQPATFPNSNARLIMDKWLHRHRHKPIFFKTPVRQVGDPRLAACVYGLNKALHGLDVFYEVELPTIFAFQHPVGTVLGRAHYSNYLLVYQRCTVGSTLSGESPTFEPGVVLFGGSS